MRSRLGAQRYTAGRFPAHVAIRGATDREPDVTPEAVALVCDDTTYESTKAQRELGYRPATLREMVWDCLGWMKAEGIVS